MSLKHYSVQPVAESGLPKPGVCIAVDARSSVQAAEIVLGETLVMRGENRKPRAVVWSLGDDYAPISVTLYAPE
jgi:hypothetical protein